MFPSLMLFIRHPFVSVLHRFVVTEIDQRDLTPLPVLSAHVLHSRTLQMCQSLFLTADINPSLTVETKS